MLHFVYTRQLWLILLGMALGAAAWGYAGARCAQAARVKAWRLANAALAAAGAAAVLYITLLWRQPAQAQLSLLPFAALASQNGEALRTLIMNVFLFFPLGLGLANALRPGLGTATRLFICAGAGLVLSICVEAAQYVFALGTAEADDVICNTLGAAAGAASLYVKGYMEKRLKKDTKQNELTPVQLELLRVLNCALRGENTAIADGIDRAELFALAQEHMLLPIIFEAVHSGAGQADAALFAAVRQQVIAEVVGQTARAADFCQIYGKLCAAGLHPIIVKGELCGALYPLKSHRISADDDILISDDELARCHEMLLGCGLQTTCPQAELFDEDEITYTKPGSALYIELHRRLFDSAEDAYDAMNPLFANVYANAVLRGGYYQMGAHDHLLYIMLHAYKHFVACGIGVRQLCDIGLWAREYWADVDWPKLRSQCASVHAFGFAAAVLEICRKYLGIAIETPPGWGSAAPIEPLLYDCLNGGIYGTKDHTRLHSSTLTLNAVKASRSGKRSSLLATIFPGKEYLRRNYAYLNIYPCLLPLAWAQRMAHYIKEKRSPGPNSAAGSIKLAHERMELMKLYGIMDKE